MSQDRRLKDILNDMDSEPGYAPDRIVEAKQAIIEVMRGCVPEEQYRPAGWQDSLGSDDKPSVVKGYSPEQRAWNACRAEVLRRIEEVGK